MRPHRQLLRGPALIRPGLDEDAPHFIALIERCWADYPNCPLDVDADAPELRALESYYRARGGALWLTEDASGMIAAAPLEAGAWEICRVYVHPDVHGSGLGPTLLHAAERHAMDAGATELVLWTDTRFLRAHAFYEKQGYVREGPIRPLEPGVLEFRYAKPVQGLRRLDVAGARSAERRLATILCACVDAGASVSFLAPLAPDRARQFWQTVTQAVGQGNTILFAAWDRGALVGTVHLLLHASELGRHRAEIAKFLVHPDHRDRGIGTALLREAESAALAAGRTLLLLDTRADDDAEALYRREGWQEVGRIADYTRDNAGCSEATVLFSKRLA